LELYAGIVGTNVRTGWEFCPGLFSGDASPLADAILDRIAHDAYRINIESIDSAKDVSMREVYGLDRSQSE